MFSKTFTNAIHFFLIPKSTLFSKQTQDYSQGNLISILIPKAKLFSKQIKTIPNGPLVL